MNGKFFKDAIRDKKLSVRGVAAMLGMKQHSQLSSMLSGKRRMQLDEAIALSKILNIPLMDVIANAGFPEVMQNGRRVPVMGILRGSGEVEPVPPNTERALAPMGLPDDATAVQARTSETPLNWMDRWVFFCGERTTPGDEMIGRYCVIGITDGPVVVGMLRRGYDDTTFSISGPYSAESARVDWVCPVLVTRH